MSGLNAQIKLEDIITSAKLQLRLQNTSEFDDFLELKIREGARHLCALSIFEKRQCALEINDNKSVLPKGFFRLLGLRFVGTTTDETTGVTTNNCYRLLYVDKKFLNDCGCNTSIDNVANQSWGFQIVGNIIHYNSSIPATSVSLAYLSFNTDDDGNIIFYEDYERALTNYACWQYSLSFFENYNQYVIEAYAAIWRTQKNWVKGNAVATQAQDDKREIAATFNALVLSNIVNY